MPQSQEGPNVFFIILFFHYPLEEEHSQVNITKDLYEALGLQGRGPQTGVQVSHFSGGIHSVNLFIIEPGCARPSPLLFMAPPADVVFYFSHLFLPIRIYLPKA